MQDYKSVVHKFGTNVLARISRFAGTVFFTMEARTCL